jgi:hypothetical protein
VIRELSPGRSRLLIRARTNYTPRRALPFVELVIGPADFLNAGAMLRGIKQRAETTTGRASATDHNGAASLLGTRAAHLAEQVREVVSR